MDCQNTVGVFSSLIKFCFYLVWGQKSQSLVRTIIVIELNITVDCSPEPFLCFIIVLAKVFLFDGCEKGFCHSIVVGTPGSGKRLLNAIIFQQLSK